MARLWEGWKPRGPQRSLPLYLTIPSLLIFVPFSHPSSFLPLSPTRSFLLRTRLALNLQKISCFSLLSAEITAVKRHTHLSHSDWHSDMDSPGQDSHSTVARGTSAGCGSHGCRWTSAKVQKP